MLILVHSSPTTLSRYESAALGVLMSPRRVYCNVPDGMPWAADNDCFAAWNPARYRSMVETLRLMPRGLFVTAPDVVADARGTARRYARWRDYLDGLPVAYVAQDGLRTPPWDTFDALFIGGSTRWKLGPVAARLARDARERGKHVHMGRVNSSSRRWWARWIGCHSVDGLSYSAFRDRYLPGALAESAQLIATPSGVL